MVKKTVVLMTAGFLETTDHRSVVVFPHRTDRHMRRLYDHATGVMLLLLFLVRRLLIQCKTTKKRRIGENDTSFKYVRCYDSIFTEAPNVHVP